MASLIHGALSLLGHYLELPILPSPKLQLRTTTHLGARQLDATSHLAHGRPSQYAIQFPMDYSVSSLPDSSRLIRNQVVFSTELGKISLHTNTHVCKICTWGTLGPRDTVSSDLPPWLSEPETQTRVTPQIAKIINTIDPSEGVSWG